MRRARVALPVHRADGTEVMVRVPGFRDESGDQWVSLHTALDWERLYRRLEGCGGGTSRLPRSRRLFKHGGSGASARSYGTAGHTASAVQYGGA